MRVGTSTAVTTALAAVMALTGCYGKQMVKGPIYTEQVHERVDSLLVVQGNTQQMINDLRSQLAEEREARIRYEAEMGLALKQLEESVRILSNQLEDRAQLMMGGSGAKRSHRPPTPVAKTAPDSTADTAAADPDANADELYRTSYMDLTRGNYDLAIQGFQNYLVRHPSGAHLPEVHYYLGESYYSRDRHLEAVSEFQYVIRVFPDSRLVRAAYLKSGLSYVALEERNLAVRSFQELVDKYPDSEEAVQARDQLARLQG